MYLLLSGVVVVDSMIHFQILHLPKWGKVIYDSSRKVKQQFAHRRVQFYLASLEQNILFGAVLQLYELLSYCEI